MNRLRKFLALPGEDQRLLIEAAGRVAWTSLGLRLLPFAYWRPRLGAAASASAAPATIPTRPAERIAWAVGVAAGYVPGATCLVQAVVARSMMSREGFPAHVHIGVRAGENSRPEAHAWLVLDGRIILGNTPGCPHVPLETPVGLAPRASVTIEAPAESARKRTAAC
ncbi:MAG: lasso peptide biosynthesis B2 protein [Acidobacteria bacterium]|nr:lasso peptide biosynthesis B2 protein [Acidobacteriota bacterium]